MGYNVMSCQPMFVIPLYSHIITPGQRKNFCDFHKQLGRYLLRAGCNFRQRENPNGIFEKSAAHYRPSACNCNTNPQFSLTNWPVLSSVLATERKTLVINQCSSPFPITNNDSSGKEGMKLFSLDPAAYSRHTKCSSVGLAPNIHFHASTVFSHLVNGMHIDKLAISVSIGSSHSQSISIPMMTADVVSVNEL